MAKHNSEVMRFLRGTDGATAVIFGFAVTVLLGFAGLAVDVGLWYVTKRNAQVATDAAALAGGFELTRIATARPTQQDLDRVTAAVTTAALQNGFDPDNDEIDVALNVIDDGFAVEVQVAKLAPLLLSGLFMEDRPLVASSGTAARAAGNMELVLVLDVSGSMRGSKIRELEAAAKNMVELLYDGREVVPNFWVGVVPFGGRVNIQDYGAGWMDSPPGGGPLCVDLRGGDNYKNDAAPSVEAFLEFSGSSSKCPSGQPAMFLTAERTTVIDRLDALNTQSGTATYRGLVWGWRMVSEDWKGLWGEPGLPHAYASHIRKSVILMTDGENRPDRLPEPWTEDEANEVLKEQCAAMKAAGITLYTVTFDTSTVIDELYRDECATPGLAFDADNASQLAEVFEKIGKAVKTVRLIN